MPAPSPTRTSAGERFALDRALAGGQGGVQTAVDRAVGRAVVLKRDELARERFLARRRLEHPGLATALGVWERDGERWLVEELVGGARWDESPPVESERWSSAACGLLTALIALHEHGWLHRDLKPENAILAPRDAGGASPVLIDFGLAVPLGDRVGPGGTLGTAAPEIFGGGRADARADLFGAGALLLSAALGIAPPPRWSLESGAIERDLERAPRACRELLGALCASDPSRRIESAARALELLPRGERERAIAAPSQWPLVARDALLDRVLAAARDRADRGFLVLLDGPSGIGKRRLASAIARELAIAAWDRAQEVSELGVLPRAGSAALSEWLRKHESKGPQHAVGVLAAASDASAYAGALPAEEILHLEVPPLATADVETLLRELGLAGVREARALREQTRGVPGALALQLAPAPRTVELSPAAQLFATAAMLRDAPQHAPADADVCAAAEEALRAGMLERTREGLLRVARPWRSCEILGALEASVRARAYQDAARSLELDRPREATDVAWLALQARLEDSRVHESDLAEAASAFASATTEMAQLERRLQLLAIAAPAAPLARAFRALEPALRRLLGEGRSAAVEALLARIRGSAEEGLRAALEGRLRFERGDLEPALALLRRAAAERAGDLDVQHDLLRALQSASRWREVLELTDALHARALAQTPEQRAVLAQARSMALLRTGSTDAAARVLRASIDELPIEPLRSLRYLALQNLGLVERHRGDLAAASRAFEEAERGFSRVGDPRAACLVDVNLAVLYQDAGQPRRARVTAERAASRARDLGLQSLECIAEATAAIASARFGASPPAVAELERVNARLRAAGLVREAAIVAVRRARAELDLGVDGADGERAGAALRAALEPASRATAPQAAAIAAAGLLEHGADLAFDFALLRALLRGADRGGADHLRCAWDRAQRGAASRERRGARLERLAERALPELAPLAYAEAARCGGKQALHRAARALRSARRIDVPSRSIEAWLAAAECALQPPRRRALHRAPMELSLLFSRMRDEGALGVVEGTVDDTAVLQRFGARLEELAARAASLPSGGSAAEATLQTLARLNGLLLDERVADAEKYERILEAAVRTTGAARGCLLVREPSGSERVVARSGMGLEPQGEAAHLELSRSVLARVLETGEPVRTVDAMADPEFRHALSVAHFHLSSIACVPLRAGARVLGALYLDHPHERGVFAEDVLERLATLADQASLSLSAARQREQIEKLNQQLSQRLEQSTRELESARAEIAASRGTTTVVHQSAVMRELLARVQRIAVSELPALVRGETGTGKELIARRLHELSPRRAGPFVSENCSALPGELLESELFGHEKGAFTGALRDKPGLLRMASGGTLFLDEIGDMPLELQTRLLRVLQESRVRPVGADREVHVDVRLITATHRDLEALVREGTFREDLYYRIRVAELAVPPLRERREDIPLLVDTFLTRQDGRAEIAPAALEALRRYAWPGNVRELEGVIRSAIVLKRGAKIEVEDLPAEIHGDLRLGSGGLPSLQLKDLERLALQEALKQVDGHRGRAADLLGISRSSVFNKLREHGLS